MRILENLLGGGGGVVKQCSAIFVSHEYNFKAIVLCVGDFKKKLLYDVFFDKNLTMLFHSLKFQFSCYSFGHLRNGSWDNAELSCNKRGAHLWSINSHEEFYHLLRKEQYDKTHFTKKDNYKVSYTRYNVGRFDPGHAHHFYIGLAQSNTRHQHTVKVVHYIVSTKPHIF